MFDMMSMPTGYGVTVGMAANTISSLRGNVSAMASNTTPPNYADEGITTVSSLDKVVNKRCYKVQCMGCYKFVSYGWEITCLTLLSPVQSTVPYTKFILKQACSTLLRGTVTGACSI